MLKSYLKEYKLQVFISVFLVAASTFAALYQPTLIGNVINALGETNSVGDVVPDMDTVRQNGLGLVALGVLGLFAGVINTFVSASIAQKIGSDIRRDIFRKVQEFAFQDIEKFTSSNLVVRMTNDVTQIQNMLMASFQMLTRIPIMFIGAFFLAVRALPNLWWTIILYIIIVLLVLMIMMKNLGPSFGKLQGGLDEVNTVVKENMDGVRVVKSFVTEEKEATKFNERVDFITAQLLKIGRTFSILIPTFMFVANILTGVSILLVSQWAIDDPALIGSLVSFTTYLMQIMFSLIMGGFLMMFIGRAATSIKRISEVLNTEASMVYGDEELTELNSLSFKNVSFRYPNADEDTLQDISFDVKRGEKVGIVGATGSGKTTLVNLIPRLYDTTEGVIEVNGADIRNYSKNTIHSRISLVLQKAILMSGDIRGNITQGNRNATQEQLEDAAKKAQAYEFIDTKEKRFDEEVLQRGNNFSGGQKQRLSIARGIIKDPEILILDDSTSALDARSENLVKEVINNELQDTTTIIVAQKISSVIDTDKIIVLNEGRVDAIGTHKELIEASEVYREIYETQKGKGVVADG